MPRPGGRYLSALLLQLSLASPGFANCVEPIAPIFPPVNDVSVATMEIAQGRMQQYINSTEEYLDCLGAARRKVKMEAVLAEMRQVTARYNALKAAYRKRKAEELFSESAG